MIKITKKQRDILVGLILGDGHLETQTNGRTYRLKVEHSQKQTAYVDWLYEEFKDLCESAPKKRTKISFQKEIISYGFTTKALGSFRFYGQQFYQNNKKVIPRLIKKMISPITLAVWFMDDGSYKSKEHKTYIIHANGYQKDELEFIKEILKTEFAIEVGIHKQYSQYRLYVYTKDAQKFKKLIEPYIILSMRYKLGNENA